MDGIDFYVYLLFIFFTCCNTLETSRYFRVFTSFLFPRLTIFRKPATKSIQQELLIMTVEPVLTAAEEEEKSMAFIKTYLTEDVAFANDLPYEYYHEYGNQYGNDGADDIYRGDIDDDDYEPGVKKKG